MIANMAGERVVAVWDGALCMSHGFPIPDEGLVLGRELLPASRDDRISRQHARIARAGEKFVVTDCGSRNGTYVNGRALSTDSVEVLPGALIRTGHTLWVIVAGSAGSDLAGRIAHIFDTVRAAAKDIAIHPSLFEECLLSPPTHWPLLGIVTNAAIECARAGRDLRGSDLEESPDRGTFAVFPGISSAVGAGRRIAKHLSGATTRMLIGGNTLVEARSGERRVAITCPPSTAYLVELYDADTLVASGRTLEDDDAIAAATAWLAGSDLDEHVRASAFLYTVS